MVGSESEKCVRVERHVYMWTVVSVVVSMVRQSENGTLIDNLTKKLLTRLINQMIL